MLLGGERPQTMMGPSFGNLKGHFEPHAVVQANDALLLSESRLWHDCRPFPLPEGAPGHAIAADFATVISSSFTGSGLKVLKDPRISVVTPLWQEAATLAGDEPVFALLLRDPMAVASSIMRRDGLTAEAALAVWLRYTLDAERYTRGAHRIIIESERFITDPVSTLEEVGRRLGLTWPTEPASVATDLNDFVDKDMFHPSDPFKEPLLGLAQEAHAALRGVARPDNAEAQATLDRIRHDFDLMATEIHGRMVLQQLTLALENKWARDAEAGHADPAESHALQLTTQLAELSELNNALHKVFLERNELAGRVAELGMELVRARVRPWEQVRNDFTFRILNALSRQSPLISPKMAARFASSASKRDPYRSLPSEAGSGLIEGANTGSRLSFEYSGRSAFNPQLKNMLIVSHDASRTGAPILALNLVQSLSNRYNVTVICLRGGDILDNFRAVSVKVHVADRQTADPSHYSDLIAAICRSQSFSFAVVNSIESRAVLKCLSDEGVASVALIHEFASYTPSKTAIPEVFASANETVFSTDLTLENALSENLITLAPTMHVIPQGKCIVPSTEISAVTRDAERAWLRKMLRPEGSDERRFVVIGAGFVQLRKGVDLFIETATRVLQSPEGAHAVFVWIGQGYNPERDYVYSAYLRDQLRRAGVEDRVLMLRETSEIELAYELADALLLSSRLDPLPNVAIDAMCVGLPVLCFEKTTGIADFLVAAGLGEDCLASYIDTGDMAGKVLALANAPDRYAEVAAKTHALAQEAFDFDAYARKIEALGLTTAENYKQADADRLEIGASGRFRPDFFGQPGRKAPASDDAVRGYLRSLASGIGPRKPEPGFHPLVFREFGGQGGGDAVDPYAAFLRKGAPAGPWLQKVIDGGARAESAPHGLNAALHIHAYFTDDLPDIVGRLQLNQTLPDLYVTVGSQNARETAANCLARYRGRVQAIDVVPNLGRDIGPFLTKVAAGLVTSYDVVGHVHVKKSADVGNAELVSTWIAFLYENILGGARGGAMLDRILGEFSRDDRLGIVYPDDPNIIGWTGNRQAAETLALRMGHADLPRSFNFPVGTMFWMRSAVLKRFTELGLSWTDYPPEPLAYDGTMLHALERLFGVIPVLDGWSSAVTNVRGVTR